VVLEEKRMIVNQDESIVSDFSVVLAGFYRNKILLHSSGGVHYLHSIMMPNDLMRVGITSPYRLTCLSKSIIKRHYPFFEDKYMREKLVFFIEKGVDMRFRLLNLVVFEISDSMSIPAQSSDYFDMNAIEDSSLLMSATTSMLICEAFDLHSKTD